MDITPRPRIADDSHDERNVALLITGVILLLFSFASAVQMFFVLTQGDRWTADPAQSVVVDLIERAGANLLGSGVGLTLMVVLRVYERRTLGRVLTIFLIASIGTALLLPLRSLMGMYPADDVYLYIVDGASTYVVVGVAIFIGLALADSRHRLRLHERLNAEQRLRGVAALEALQAETLRVHRRIAENLHGTVQNHLVVIGAWLDELAPRLVSEDVARLGQVRAELDRIREVEVRQLSHALYPTGFERGVSASFRSLLRRLPESIATTLDIDERFQSLDSDDVARLSLSARLLLVRSAEEAITNALRHGQASAIRMILRSEPSHGTEDMVVLRVDDDGNGLRSVASSSPHDDVSGGLGYLRSQAEGMGATVSLADNGAGATLEVRIPVLPELVERDRSAESGAAGLVSVGQDL